MRQKFSGYLRISQLMKVSDRNICWISMVITMLTNAKHSGQTTCMHHIRQSSIATVCSVQHLLWNNVFGLGEVIQSWCIKSFLHFFFLMRSQGDSSDVRFKIRILWFKKSVCISQHMKVADRNIYWISMHDHYKC